MSDLPVAELSPQACQGAGVADGDQWSNGMFLLPETESLSSSTYRGPFTFLLDLPNDDLIVLWEFGGYAKVFGHFPGRTEALKVIGRDLVPNASRRARCRRWSARAFGAAYRLFGAEVARLLLSSLRSCHVVAAIYRERSPVTTAGARARSWRESPARLRVRLRLAPRSTCHPNDRGRFALAASTGALPM